MVMFTVTGAMSLVIVNVYTYGSVCTNGCYKAVPNENTSSQALKGSKSTSLHEVDLLPLACEDDDNRAHAISSGYALLSAKMKHTLWKEMVQ